MPHRVITAIILFIAIPTTAQQLTLDSCRTLALENNKKLQISKIKEEAAHYQQCAAATTYFPRIDAEGIYIHTPHKTSLLGSSDKKVIQNLGNTIEESLKILIPQIPSSIISAPLNEIGNSIADALTLDTRNIFVANIAVTQPLFTGGKIIAYNKLTRLAREAAQNSCECTRQDIIQETDQAYWLVVSLTHKVRLARSYITLTRELLKNIEKLKQQGMATTADLLKVNVKLNEATTAHLKATDALSLAKMALCYICGLPLDSNPALADENINPYTSLIQPSIIGLSIDNRPELKNLAILGKISHQQTNIVRSDFLPHIALTGGYTLSNPNLRDGFRRKFGGTWNVGIIMKIPIWNWGEGKYKIRAAKAQERIAQYTFEEARNAMYLQLKQAQQQLHESYEHHSLALSNISTAQENLRNANIAFAEGMYTSEELMQAQTAWLQAESTLIDAKIDVILAHTQLLRVTGNLGIDYNSK